MEQRRTPPVLGGEESPEQAGLHRCSAKDHVGERWLPPDAFWRKTAASHTYQYRCKDCQRRDARQRYARNPQAMRERSKRFCLRGYVQPQATQERNNERKRRERLEVRLARTRLLLLLVAQDYGLPVPALYGPSPGGTHPRATEAQALAVRLIRQLTFLPAEQIAAVMDCTPRAVERRLKRVRAWTHPQRGDIRVRERVRRITAAYRRVVPSRAQERAGR